MNTESNTYEQIEGRNAVLEALKGGRVLDKVYIAKFDGGAQDRALSHIASTARAQGAVVSNVDRRRLDAMSRTHAHQGVIAIVPEFTYSEISDILALAELRGEPPLIVICDEVTDPHNLGAIIRSAECAGAHGVIIPKRRSAGFSSAIVEKASAGAISHLPVARVANLSSAIKELKAAGLWITAAEGSSETPLWDCDFTLPSAIVIGSEGEGLRQLVAENCDFKAAIPLKGKISSLNASNACAILLFEAIRQ
ncbi:MAG: 23S rRNA (guanosine(2251)-2'-O)-methyltransferase RlmB, partial [Oscillospiraceae bacterium]|nr:23S rRNA (guanosine(2251)-2'-O)-methyltransferase RlmB [Oscillospiraceae bacterium]